MFHESITPSTAPPMGPPRPLVPLLWTWRPYFFSCITIAMLTGHRDGDGAHNQDYNKDHSLN